MTTELIITNLTDQQLVARQRLSELTNYYTQQSLSKSTLKMYTSDLKLFVSWCEELGFIAMPATPDTIADFLSAEARRGIKPATLIRRLAAIKMAHETYDHESPTQHKKVTSTLKGIKRNKGTAPDKKSPATAKRIEAMIAHCPDTLKGLRDKALLLIGFSGAFRRSELVALTVDDIESTDEGIKVTIRKSKGDQEGQGQIIGIPNGAHFRAVDHLTKWLEEANITEGCLFRSIKKRKKDYLVQPMGLTGKSVAKIVKYYADKAGFTVGKFSGHSLRSGFITSSAAEGSGLVKIMEVSRHKKPETVMGYVRESNLFENHAGEKFL